MKKNKKSFKMTFDTTKYMFLNLWRKRPGKIYLLLKAIFSLIDALFPLINVIFPGLLINELTGDKNIHNIILYACVILISPLIVQLIKLFVQRYMVILNNKISILITEEFYDHAIDMDYETVENPKIQELQARAHGTICDSVCVIDQLYNFASSIISLIAISSIIISLNLFIIIWIIALIYVESLVDKHIKKKQFKNREKFSKYSRYEWAISYMLDNFDFAKEIRLFNLKKLLLGKLTDNQKKIDKVSLENMRYSYVGTLTSTGTSFARQAVLYAYLIYLIIKEGLPVGNMTIFLSATGRFSGALSSVMKTYLQLYESSLSIQELIEYMNIPLRQHQSGTLTPVFDKDSVIEFRNVSFKYPGSDIYALKNLNITVKGSEKLCIVGVNGSGKSTFIKLLTRLYFPTEGEIYLNGVNINEYDYVSYQRLFAPVFQDFNTFIMSMEENIVLAKDYDSEKLDQVCEQSGLKKLIDKLPKGYETQIGKDIDEEGIEPSGGEAQRIAIARACYRGGNVFLLDEPTAALDPMAEYEIYTQFTNMITDKCAVLITHRLSAVQLADKVAVFDDGHVAEYGTHRELYANGGIYTEMFDKQAQFYRDSQNEEKAETDTAV